MNNEAFSFLMGASYPCYFLADDGELYMNKAAEGKGPPFNDEAFMRKIIGDEACSAGEDAALPRRAMMPAGVLSLQAFTVMPVEGGVMCILTAPRDEASLNFSRQIREPLAEMFALLPALAAGKDKTDVERLENIQVQCYRLLRITANMENISRLEKGAFKIGVVDFGELLQELCDSTAILSRKTGIALHRNIAAGQLLVRGNAHLLEEAVLNILRNSYQYTRDDNEITLTLKRVGKQALLSVSDKGLGIKSEFIPQIFTPYFSVDPYGDNPEKPGLGLGLAIVKLTAQNMGGSVTAQSEFGRGTTISMAIPLNEAGGEILESDAAGYVSNRYSPVYVQMEGIVRMPEL